MKTSTIIRKEKDREHSQAYGLQHPVFRTGRDYDSAASTNGIAL